MSSRSSDPPPSRPELRRVLNSWDAGALIVGIIIGSGIFATPPLVAGHLHGTGLILLVWTLGGVMALCGALCFAELSSMFPETGGQYVYLREGYGRFPAFAYGWCALFVSYPASIAAIAIVFADYFVRLVPGLAPHRPLLAASVCALLAAINILGVRIGAMTLRVFAAAKILALAAIPVVAFLLTKGSPRNLAPVWEAPEGFVAPFALSLVAVLWTYEGWSDGPTLAGEMQDPKRDLVRALVVGTLGVTVIYLLTNLAYLYVLGSDGVKASESVAVDVAERLFGKHGSLFVTLLVLVSTLGAVLGSIVGGSRIFFALARDGLFLRSVGKVDPRFGTPSVALGVVGFLSAVYCLWGTFEEIIRYFVFIATLWFILNVSSVVLHRVKRPDHPRPFRVPWYPWPVVLYLLAAVALWIQILLDSTRDSLVGLGVLVLAFPVYVVWRRIAKPSP